VAESGLPAYQSSGWFGLLAPAGTPTALIARLNQAVVAAVASPDVKQRFFDIAVDPASNTPAEFASFVRDQLAVHRQLVQKLGMKFD